MKDKNELKVITVINLGWLGDVLLTSVLCQDIKLKYPDSKLIFIVSKPFFDIAKGIPGVDEVFSYDKKLEHKGFLGIFKFAFKFHYKNKVDASFVVHTHERSLLLSFAIGSKLRISAPIKFKPLNLLITHPYKYTESEIRNTYKADFNAKYLGLLTGELPKSKMKFEYPKQAKEEIETMLENNNYQGFDLIGFSPCSKDKRKDWTPEDASEFIKLVNATGRRVVLTGTERAFEFAQQIRELTNEDFLDLSSQTTIFQLSALIGRCKAFVSVDTGSMHISYSIGTPTLCLFFFNDMVKEWAPQDTANNVIIYNPDKIIAQESFEKLMTLLDKNSLVSNI